MMTASTNASGSPAAAPHKGYRADIDGLRAVAVIVILLFHAEIAPFSGGFVGVDIFFVISGYLITRLIEGEIATGSFSIATFYRRRIRRLFPALFAMLAVTMVFGALVLLPRDFASMGRNVVGTTLFVSNIFFWEQAGYFDGDAHYKPLLHTWSLAVEEQFYIVFPFLLIVLRRFIPTRLPIYIAIIAVASFVASLVMMTIDPTTAFYLTPFRAWEFMLGSLLALRFFPPISSRTLRNAGAGAGALMIAYAVFFYSDLTHFPGMSALLPCVGTALLIHTGEGGTSIAGRVLSSRLAVGIGLISYSVYLWHWPLFVFARYYAIEELTTLQSLALGLASIGIGALSWRYIELPFRTAGPRTGRAPVFVLASTATVALFAVGGSIYFAKGLPERFPQKARALSKYALSMNPETDMCARVDLQLAPNSPCTIGDPKRASVFLWGDSHAGTLFGALEAIAQEGVGTVYGATPRCPPLLELGTDRGCIAANRQRLDYVLAHPEIRTVILAARWSLYFNGRLTEEGTAETNGNLPRLIDSKGESYDPLTREARRKFRAGLFVLVKQLLANGKRVVLVYPIPETGFDIPSTLARMSSQGDNPASFTIPRTIYDRRQSDAIRVLDQLGRRKRLERVYPEDALCPDKACLTYANGAALYFDSHHLSIPGSRILLPQLRRALRLPARALTRKTAAGNDG